MSYIVSARKYRPLRFEDVVGQEHVSQTLKKALQTEHLAHAFLFCGPRGVGKTTCARILAKVLNCSHVSDNTEPCGKCDSCKSFSENASFNIMELDAASNNSVEHIRTLVDQVRFQPQQGKYKVFIIDEVHMLSQSAFNAFLKTLEEPPPYAVFILATTEKHKIIPTILSRCQIFDFKRISVKDIVKHLQSICGQEGIEADKDALHIVAQKADGALRDALSIFDRIVASAGQKIRYEDVIANLNVLDFEYFFRFTDALLVQDLPQVMLIFDEVLRNGFDGDLFINGLAEHLRNLLVCKDEKTLRLLEVSDSLRDRYRQQASIAPASFLLTALNLANDCDINYKMARNKRIHVEMALIKTCFISQAVQLAVGTHQPSVISHQAAVSSGEKKKPELKVALPLITAPKEPTVDAAHETGTKPEDGPETLSDKELFDSATDAARQDLDDRMDDEDSEGLTLSRVEEPSAVFEKKPAAPVEKDIKAPSLRKPKTGGIPTLQSLDSMHAELEVAETNGALKKEAKLTQEDLSAAWTAYIDSIDRDSVKMVLKNTEISLEGKKVIVVVGSVLAENTIRQESNLMDYIREQLHAPRLSLELKMDAAKAPAYTAPAKPLTDSEKYWRMKTVNPLVDEVRKRFDLQFDQE